ncbi:MAG: diguanylate cyclase [Campylobacterales bacterium]|nr:diguanylate cyclase [Campylobacterales bacterium]
MKCVVGLFLLSIVISSSMFAESSTEKIRLQLKWFSSFQFAGYYMALEKGFYREAGLDVTILERDPDKNNIDQVVNGEVEYGVADSALLLYRAEGKPVQIMASIFQHSPLIFIAHKDSGIVSPYEMKGKKVSYQKGIDDAPLLAMLEDAHIAPSDYTYTPLDFTNMAFIRHEVDVMSAYSSDQPFRMKELKIPITIINPLNYGIDFYGDNLFSTEKELSEHSDRAKLFLEASIRGWRYALANRDETISVLRNKYNAKSSVEHLKYEAQISENMMMPSMVDIGYTNPQRFYRIAEIYRAMNKANKADIDRALEGLIWNPYEKHQIDVRYFYIALALLASIVVVTIALIIISRKLKAMVIKRTRALEEQQMMTDKYVIISATDLKGSITYVSKAFCDISGYTKEELIGKEHTIIRHTDTSSSLHQELWKHLHTGKVWSGEIKNRAKDGTIYWVRMNIEPILNEENITIGYRSIQQNITDKKYAEELSITDQLTQLYNRGYLDKILDKEMNRFGRYGTPMSVIMIDIDYFKEVNDLYGHLSGDRVLIELAQILKSNIRTTDTLGRWGGEEFMIICSQNTLNEALQLAEKLRLAIESYPFPRIGTKTASFGVASVRSNENELGLIQRVDNALYQAKALGRNRVEG